MEIHHDNEKPNLFPKKDKSKNNRLYSPIPDIWIEKFNAVIEIYGDFWHANPKFYLSEDIIPLFAGPTKAADIWKMDDIRKTHIESFGVTLITIWEDDINNNFDLVKRVITHKLNIGEYVHGPD